jgi:regulatory protein
MQEEVSTKVSARAVLMDYLARREHSQSELRAKALKRLGSSAEVEIEEALVALADDGLQSDQRFTESLCRQRISKGYGPNFLQQLAREKGITKEQLSDALETLAPDWFDCAQETLRKKFTRPIDSSVDYLERRKELQRRMRFLSYRGYPSSVISAVVAADDDSDN